MKYTVIPVILAIAIAGCAESPPAAAPAEKPLTWAEYQKLAPEEQSQPAVVSRLDDDAKKKLAAQQRNPQR